MMDFGRNAERGAGNALLIGATGGGVTSAALFSGTHLITEDRPLMSVMMFIGSSMTFVFLGLIAAVLVGGPLYVALRRAGRETMPIYVASGVLVGFSLGYLLVGIVIGDGARNGLVAGALTAIIGTSVGWSWWKYFRETYA